MQRAQTSIELASLLDCVATELPGKVKLAHAPSPQAILFSQWGKKNQAIGYPLFWDEPQSAWQRSSVTASKSIVCGIHFQHRVSRFPGGPE